jgi:cytochrome c
MICGQKRGALLMAMAFVLAAAVAGAMGQTASKKPPHPPAPASTSPARGKGLYDARCEICHFSASTAKKIGPGLKGVGTRGKFADGSKVDDDKLRRWIVKGGKNMPGFADLNADEVRDLIAYLKTL